MSLSILSLPPEILDNIFDYLPVIDKTNARLVCRQWNRQLSAPRYFRALKLNPIVASQQKEVLLRTASQGKFHRIIVCDSSVGTASKKDIVSMVQILEASRFSLKELLMWCTGPIMPAVVRALASWNLPQVPRMGTEPVGFTFITHLDTMLRAEIHLQLVSSLASQLKSLVVAVYYKILLVRCLNDIHLPALKILNVQFQAWDHLIYPEELGEEFARLLLRLETFRFKGINLFVLVLPEMLRNCQNLECLEICCCDISVQTIERIGALQKLKDLCLNLRIYGGPAADPPVKLNLPNVEHLTLSVDSNIALGEQMPKLTSVTVDGRGSEPKAIILELKKIAGFNARRLRKLSFINASLHVMSEVNEWIGTLSIDTLSFEQCGIDGSLLQILAKPEIRGKILKIRMVSCDLYVRSRSRNLEQMVAALRKKCPYLQIVATDEYDEPEDEDD